MKGTNPSNKPQLIVYTHNLGRFYGLFLIDALLIDPSIKLIPTFKDNVLITLDIVFNLKKEIIISPTLLGVYLYYTFIYVYISIY